MIETYTYDANGYLTAIKIGGQRVWELNSYNGTYRTIKLGATPLTLSKSYSSSSGVLSSATISNSSGPLHIFSYTFDGSGNLTNRYGMTNGNETFSYDEFDRLKTGVSYSINGNINSKTGIGNYTYDANKKNAVVQVQNSGNLIPKENVDVTYNAFNKVATVIQGGNKLTITYGPDRQRVKTVLVYGGATTTTLYAGNYEQRTAGGVTTTYHYVASPDGLIAVYVKKNGTTTPYYVETDHLGSIINLFDASGTKQFSATYDAWGKQTITKNAIGLTRGYTGHEHWNQFGLIDMNGRFYDPLIGRFLSPDPYVQVPSNLQNFNRYSYCLNNPLKYIDLSGEFWHIVIGAAIGGTINVLSHWGDIDNIWEGIGSFTVGAGAGALTAVTGGATSGFWASSAVGYCAVAVSGGSLAAGNDIIRQSDGTTLKGIDWGQVGNSTLYGIGGSLASSFVGCPFEGGKFSNTLNHIVGSAAYNFGGKLASGQNPFKNIDRHYFGLDWTAILPITTDGTKYCINKTNVGNRFMNKYDNNRGTQLQKFVDEANNENNYNLTSDDFNFVGFSETTLENTSNGTFYFNGIANYIMPNLGQNKYDPNDYLTLNCASKCIYLGILFKSFLFK